ncbi:hypothetical protein KQX54_019191 [Cotesia glomerata]|uniref:Uncharacterized protein n=1 Tax=Cotesia glomerata TaxID=32391 RepID=A0AAV7IDN2_COTGL|nr:hypothetical protein KQX54_019191 [Cotesia glomerata]
MVERQDLGYYDVEPSGVALEPRAFVAPLSSLRLLRTQRKKETMGIKLCEYRYKRGFLLRRCYLQVTTDTSETHKSLCPTAESIHGERRELITSNVAGRGNKTNRDDGDEDEGSGMEGKHGEFTAQKKTICYSPVTQTHMTLFQVAFYGPAVVLLVQQ